MLLSKITNKGTLRSIEKALKEYGLKKVDIKKAENVDEIRRYITKLRQRYNQKNIYKDYKREYMRNYYRKKSAIKETAEWFRELPNV
jgi:hypothetical protein